MINNICIISQRYPSKATPTVHVFVQKIAWEFADKGKNVTIVSPVPYFDKDVKKIPEKYIETTKTGKKITVYRPRFMYFGQKNILNIKLSHISEKNFYNACVKIINKIPVQDVFYGHFICLAGICACKLGNLYKKPSFIAYGESTDWSIKNYGIDSIKKELSAVTGIISVSTNNKNILTNLGVVEEEKIGVFVNGINSGVFFPRDKKESRKMFGLDEKDKVVSFVGQFSERKGIDKLDEAMKMNPGIKALYAGAGEKKPSGDYIKYCDRLLPEKIPYLLCASDVFVFPSVNEGCSNALLEAIACGIPIIAADLPFNYDILDESNSLLIDVTSVDEISKAIKNIFDNRQKLQLMKDSSLKKSKELSISKRADNILKWMEEKIK